jgi:hypothetical protein
LVERFERERERERGIIRPSSSSSSFMMNSRKMVYAQLVVLVLIITSMPHTSAIVRSVRRRRSFFISLNYRLSDTTHTLTKQINPWVPLQERTYPDHRVAKFGDGMDSSSGDNNVEIIREATWGELNQKSEENRTPAPQKPRVTEPKGPSPEEKQKKLEKKVNRVGREKAPEEPAKLTKTQLQNAGSPEEDPKNRGQRPAQEITAPGQANKATMDKINRESERQMRIARKDMEGLDESVLPEVPDVVESVKAQISALRKKGMFGAAPDVLKQTGHFDR